MCSYLKWDKIDLYCDQRKSDRKEFLYCAAKKLPNSNVYEGQYKINDVFEQHADLKNQYIFQIKCMFMPANTVTHSKKI